MRCTDMLRNLHFYYSIYIYICCIVIFRYSWSWTFHDYEIITTLKNFWVFLEGFVRVEWNRARWHKKGMEGESRNDIWLVVSNMNLFSISYMGCHPNPLTFIFFKMVKTTNQTWWWWVSCFILVQPYVGGWSRIPIYWRWKLFDSFQMKPSISNLFR